MTHTILINVRSAQPFALLQLYAAPGNAKIERTESGPGIIASGLTENLLTIIANLLDSKYHFIITNVTK